jgi:hypothetical protein
MKTIQFSKIPLFKIINHKKYYFNGSSTKKIKGKCYYNLPVVGKHGQKYATYKKPDCYRD